MALVALSIPTYADCVSWLYSLVEVNGKDGVEMNRTCVWRGEERRGEEDDSGGCTPMCCGDDEHEGFRVVVVSRE